MIFNFDQDEFKAEFIAKNEMIATLEMESKKWKSESESRSKRYNELETQYTSLDSKSKQLQNRVDTLESLKNVNVSGLFIKNIFNYIHF